MASQLNVDVIVAESTADVQINDSLDVTGAMDVDGAATLNSTLDVDGATTLNGNVTLGNAITDTIRTALEVQTFLDATPFDRQDSRAPATVDSAHHVSKAVGRRERTLQEPLRALRPASRPAAWASSSQ